MVLSWHLLRIWRKLKKLKQDSWSPEQDLNMNLLNKKQRCYLLTTMFSTMVLIQWWPSCSSLTYSHKSWCKSMAKTKLIPSQNMNLKSIWQVADNSLYIYGPTPVDTSSNSMENLLWFRWNGMGCVSEGMLHGSQHMLPILYCTDVSLYQHIQVQSLLS